ncbi:MAG: glycosyltransferase family 4 protein [Oscillospiraceae bacterium]
MLGHKQIPSRKGGVEIVVQELSTRMVEKGHNVTCYNRSVSKNDSEKNSCKKIKEYKGVNIKNVLTLNVKGLAAITSSFFGAIRCAFGRYDVVHFHAEGPCAMLWLPKLFGKRCIATIHGLDWQREKWGGFATKYIRFGEKTAAKYADEIIVLSENVQNYFMREYGRKTEFVPNGVNVPEIREADIIKDKWNLEKDSYILFLGRLVPEKGIKYLIEAYKQIKTNKKLVIAGGSSDTDTYVQELKELCKDDDRIIFTGFVQGQPLEELYSNAYVYTLPSDLEGMPISLLEAMSYGNCCLVSDIPECAEVVEDKAVLFEKSNVEDLRDKLAMLCDNADEADKYKKVAKDYICSKYNWDEVVDKTLDLYKRKKQ